MSGIAPRRWIYFLPAVLILPLLLFSAALAGPTASSLPDEEIRATLNKTMKALLTDESFSPVRQEAQDRWMLGMPAHQYTNYYVKRPWLSSPAVVMVSTETKDRLRRQAGISKIFAQNIQELIIFERGRLENAWRESPRIYEQKSLEAFEKKAGMKPVTLSAAEQKYFQQAAAAAWKKLAGTVCPRKIMNDILRALQDYRARQAD
ncbi:MAG: hypothetical protein ACLFPD_09755 [Desulfosudaceae bacterium]